ncbi:hypothetical protein LWI29_016230 [Acer saccharum]|uniref:AB hydrolase-1 domain-containing protein n=1 Tax=Acer saccharum TaxID=4024 RepID=A0AA39S7T4_ACESA|nr:hypothetical protein LWI29_016230 [Acer saccharum]KAK1562078.1 hypothetical protein Q3G72_005836 [Acer saccharum]
MARILKKKQDGYNLLTRFLNSPNPTKATTRQVQTLAYEELQAFTGKPYNRTAIFLHGLLGSGRNWRSFSRNLASTLSRTSPSSAWRMVVVDLRNHGRSAEIEGLEPPHDMANAANDLANLVKSQGWAWPDVVIGHSMGGKVALHFAQSCSRAEYDQSAASPKQLWVLDSVPGAVNPRKSDGEVEKVLQTLQSLPSTVPSRKWLVNHMMELGFTKSLSEWIGSNLKKSGEHETWAFNLEGAVQMFNSYCETSYWPLLEHPPQGMEIAIVRAEKSDRWDPDVIQRLESQASEGGDGAEGKVSVHILPNSGHWVHVDNPQGLLEIMAPKIASI